MVFIKIRANKGNVVLDFHSNRYPISDYFHTFLFHADNVASARLLANHMQDALRDSLEKVRKEAYEAGYKAGKQKQKKQKYFSRSFNY